MKNLNSGGNKSGKVRKPYSGRRLTNYEVWNTVWNLLEKMMVKDIKKKTT